MAASKDAPHLTFDAPTGDSTVWYVAFDGVDSYILRNIATGIYLGSKSDPTVPAAQVEGTPEPMAWQIERGPEPETFTLSLRASKGAMRLSDSMVRIAPPPVGWAPAGFPVNQVWRLERA
ncbi:hypothetical protein BE17_37585 [Sorangium cellulosum]|uniref:Ricin B lectin domain-containing protein n=1 Tax=Sorangium cellulosum TaxID=56 RepID=A0A150R4K6_SORCE|nr:hypothetical protein BE17_37585 [Sorangium cellulosum]